MTEILFQEQPKKPVIKKEIIKSKLPAINPKIKPEPIKQEVIQIKSNLNVSRSGREIKVKREHYDMNDSKFEEDNKKIKLHSSKKVKMQIFLIKKRIKKINYFID